MIQNFQNCCRELHTCGFSMGGGNAKGIFALIDYDWLNQDLLDAEESYEKIRQQILLLNPTAEEKTIRKFIRG